MNNKLYWIAIFIAMIIGFNTYLLLSILFPEDKPIYTELELISIEHFEQFVSLDYKECKKGDDDQLGENDKSTYFLYNNEIIKSDCTTWQTIASCYKAQQLSKTIKNIFAIVEIEGVVYKKLIRLNYNREGIIIVHN